MNDLTVEQQQLVDDLAEEILSGFIDIVMVHSLCEPERIIDGVRTTIFPPIIQYRLAAFRAKLRAHLNAYCFVQNVFSKEESFTVEVKDADEIMSGCTAIIEEFNARVLELYKQNREVLEPHYSQAQWSAHNFLNAFKQDAF